MRNLWMMVGLPRSGKSTHSQGLGFPVVSCDAIRQSLCCYPFTPAMEPYVWAIARTMVESLFNAGHGDVVLDSCLQTVERRQAWRSGKWSRRFILVDTPIEICKERATNTGQEYLIPIIEKMSSEFELLTEQELEEGGF